MTRDINLYLLRHLAAWLVGASLILAACSTADADTPAQKTPAKQPRTGELTPFSYRSATPSPEVKIRPSPTALPSITPTPRTHIVKKGEDMLGIAILYNITLQELIAANPEVKPNLMSVGTVLIIPGNAVEEQQVTTTSAAVRATALPVNLSPVFCAVTQEGGAWCSLAVSNPQQIALEGVVSQLQLVDRQNNARRAQEATLPLDLLQPGQILPIAAYFAPPLPADYEVFAEIVSALPYPGDDRYLPVKLGQQKVIFTENGLSASITLDILLPPGASAKRVWVAATAYDQQGNVIGLRRWEKPANQVLDPGKTFPVSLNVYSTAGPIARIELAAEARP
jgi:LysM repeat protein